MATTKFNIALYPTLPSKRASAGDGDEMFDDDVWLLLMSWRVKSGNALKVLEEY